MSLVLIGDDGSDAAAHAVEWATRFAAGHGSELVAVHVRTPAASVDRWEPRLDRTEVREGQPAHALVQAAEDLDADLLVLGRRGLGGFPSLPIGSTAHVVAATTLRPVVVVPRAAVPDPLAGIAVVGLDGLPESEEAAAWAVRTFPDARFVAVHALEIAPALAYLEPAEGSRLYERTHRRAVGLMRDHWCAVLTRAGVPLDVVVEEGGPAEVLLEHAARVDADLVVVSRRDGALTRGTLGSVSQRVLAYAPCPSVLVPFVS